MKRSLLILSTLLLLAFLVGYSYKLGYLQSYPVELPASILLLGIPTAYYLLLARPNNWPLITVGSVWGIMAGLCYWLLPVNQHSWGNWISYFAGVLEAVALGSLVWNIRAIRRNYRQVRADRPDFILALETAVYPVAGRATAALAAEIAILRYALMGSWARTEAAVTDQQFRYDQDSGIKVVVLLGIGLLAVEATVVHLLLIRWNTLAAGLWLALDVYMLGWLLAHRQAVRLRPVLLSVDALTVRVGLIWQVRIPLAALAGVELVSDVPMNRPQVLNAAKPLLTTPNLLLTLKEAIPVKGPYGLVRQAKHIALYVDRSRELQSVLNLQPA